MLPFNLKALIGKLNDATRAALEGAAGLCLARTHYEIEIEHFLLKLLEPNSSDIPLIAQHFRLDSNRLTNELNRSLDKLKTGTARTPSFSPSLVWYTVCRTLGSTHHWTLTRPRSAPPSF